ncbi:hypothetical protein ACFOEK_06220 [Litoribrevibacter euphylliae]|uniref:Uncharacterized protein n=1 Tax=Litoribrevibacter euphylliae TaxID=1834034 RepID=A0ABV7HGY9_9GAMM
MNETELIQELERNNWNLTNVISETLAYEPVTTDRNEVVCKNSHLRFKLLEKIWSTEGDVKYRSINRFILQQEILHTKGGCWGFPGAMSWAVENLYSIGHPEDLILLYEAKYINWDTEMGVLSQYFLGGDTQEAINYLKNKGTKEALEVADFIDGM